MNYLVVDDEKLARNDMERMLRKILPGENEIFTASSGREALFFVRKNPIYTAFLDVDMPEMSGLELAERLCAINPRTNIIFVTAYAQYSLDAWKIYASGFLMKPASEEDIREILGHLRFPQDNRENMVEVRCFGNFEIYYKKRVMAFERTKSKEFVAFLIDRRGAMVSENEIRLALWEESLDTEAKKTYIRSLASDIRRSFEKIGYPDILNHTRGCYSLDVTCLYCDYLRYLEGDEEARTAFTGEYMRQYSWAEETLAGLVMDR